MRYSHAQAGISWLMFTGMLCQTADGNRRPRKSLRASQVQDGQAALGDADL